jgi:hypothetical protein
MSNPTEPSIHERIRIAKLEKKERLAEQAGKEAVNARLTLKATMMAALVGPPGDFPLEDAITAADEAAEAILKRLRL